MSQIVSGTTPSLAGTTYGPFSYASNRLLRADWTTQGIDALSQEMYAILQTAFTSTNGQSTTNQTPGQTSQIYNQTPDDPAPAVTFTKGDDVLTLGGDGIFQNGLPIGDTPSLTSITGDDGQVPIMLLGQVVSGSGKNYTVSLWGKDPTSSSPNFTVQAVQQNLDPTAQIPGGTTVLAIGYIYGPIDKTTNLYPTHWFLLVPTWQ